MFVFTSARVSNDAAVTAFASLTVWGAVHLAMKGLSRKSLVLTGAVLGLAILSKLSGVALAPVVALALLIDSWRRWQERPRSPWHRRLLSIAVRWAWLGLAALAICGWWFARNAILYQEWVGVDAWLSHTATVRTEPIGVLEVIPELRGLEKSYWAMFGWFNIAAAPWMYHIWWALARLALIGVGLLIVDQWTARRFSRPQRWGSLILVSAFLLNLASVWRFIMIVLGAQGRYLMPTVAPISALLVMGLGRLVPEGSPPYRRHQALAAGIGVSHLALTLVCLCFFILPAYAKPEAVEKGDLPKAMNRLDLSFDGTSVELLGGFIETEKTRAGKPVPLSLYWQAAKPPEEDYRAFVQILGRDMEPIAGVDCYPGGGTFPPTLWQPGVIYRDRYQLPVAAGAEAPTAGLLHAGLYAEHGKRLQARRSADQPPLALALLDRVAVRPGDPTSAEVTHPIGARLGKSITLVGYNASAERVSPGGTLTVTLVWRAEGTLDVDYTSFVHLVNEDGKLIAQSDHPPLSGAYPTSLWETGDVIRDPHRVEVDATSTSGACALSVGMYNSKSDERLPAYAEPGGARLRHDVIVAGQVTIE
jgi:hypothetical protein